VWNGVNYGTNTPQRDYPKAWAWKSAYHSFEHALVGYITAQYLHGQPAKLHYAFQKPAEQALIYPYYFPGTVQSVDVTTDSAGNLYQTVSFSGPVPAATPALTTVSAASFLAGPLAPGSIATAFGTHLSTDTQTPPVGQVFLTSPGNHDRRPRLRRSFLASIALLYVARSGEFLGSDLRRVRERHGHRHSRGRHRYQRTNSDRRRFARHLPIGPERSLGGCQRGPREGRPVAID
jgi:hypothetical protein